MISNINSSMTYCNNCGHESHCGLEYHNTKGALWKENIEVCKHCRCEKCESNYEDEEKYNIES